MTTYASLYFYMYYFSLPIALLPRYATLAPEATSLEGVMFDAHLYDMAFLTKEEAGRDHPEIVFIIPAKHLNELYQRIAHLNVTFGPSASKYFGGQIKSFLSPTTDLFGGFGYGDGGYVTIDRDDVWLRIPLRQHTGILEATYTIHVLAAALYTSFEEEVAGNCDQQVFLETRADMHSDAGWGHMLGGYLGPSFIMWLKRYGEEHKDGQDTFWSAPLPESVLEAMRTTWKAVSTIPERKYVSDIRGRISHEGRFLMICTGNACDIAIYPEQYIDEDCKHVRFGCHNLDNPEQQLTLLAGLVKLTELARKDE